MIVLEDLREMNEEDVLEHLATSYSGTESGFDYGEISDNDVVEAKEKLKNIKVLIAYESVGSSGCDSSSFFLLLDKKTRKMYEVHGSHHSCFGFEGQLDLEETHIKALFDRVEKGGNVFHAGAYDDNKTENQKAVNDYIRTLAEKEAKN